MSSETKMPSFGKEMRKTEFTLKGGVTFINHGSYGVVPKRVQQAQKRIVEEMESFPDLWFRTIRRQQQDEARHCISEFVNADPEDVVFVQNATTGVNCVLKSLHMEAGDIILCTDNTYNAVKYTCQATQQLSRTKDVSIEYLPLKFPINTEEEVVDMYRDYFRNNPKVKIAVIDHITSPSAIRMPIEKLIPLCKEFEVLSLIDGAHAPGQIPLNLMELNADFYTGNLHKWLFAPRGCAILHVNKKHQDWVKPVVTSHGHNLGFQENFFQQATRDDSPYCVVPEAVNFYRENGGYEAIREYIDGLLKKARDHLMTTWKTEKLPIPESMEAPFMKMILLPKLEGLSTFEKVEQRMIDNIFSHNIASQITIVDNKTYSRISANIYNTEEDYHVLCKMVLEQQNKT